MIGIPLGFVAVNYIEWHVHKYYLHGRGKNRKSPYSIHWDHHREARKHGFLDPEHYGPTFRTTWESGPAMQEVKAILAGAAAVSVLFPVAPFFTMTLWYGGWNYWSTHRKAHLDLEWAREHVPWHVDHHMNTNQNANWCVTKPWFDYILGTRISPDPKTRETNPLGMKLPPAVEAQVNALARLLFPGSFEKVDELAAAERADRAAGRQGFVPEFART